MFLGRPPLNLPFAMMSFIIVCHINLSDVQLQGVRYPQGYPLLLVQGLVQLWRQLCLRRQLSVQDLQGLSFGQPRPCPCMPVQQMNFQNCAYL